MPDLKTSTKKLQRIPCNSYETLIPLFNHLPTRPLTVFSSKRSGGHSSKFYTGRVHPEVQTLTLLYTFLIEKVPLSYTFHRNWYPFPIPIRSDLVNFSLQKPLNILKHLDESAVRCVCSKYFESRF